MFFGESIETIGIGKGLALATSTTVAVNKRTKTKPAIANSLFIRTLSEPFRGC